MTIEEFVEEWNSPSPTVLVHTSGSTGEPKPMLVEKHRMEASARITCRFLGLKPGNTALLCLPLDFIAGKMMVVRALTCGLKLQSIEPTGCPVWQETPDFAAMVPLQVFNLLQTEEGRQRAMQIRHLIIGGGPIDDTLATQLAAFPNNVWSTYGMTETLSHIALRRLNGPEATEWYTPLDGVDVSLSADGCLVVNAPAVCPHPLTTNDIAQFKDGTFRILGRKDNVICSGGIKIQIEEVERMLHPHLHVPFIITKAPDKKLGEQVVLLAEDENVDFDCLLSLCRRVLPRYYVPRQVVGVSHIPLTATGKPARKEAERIAQSHWPSR